MTERDSDQAMDQAMDGAMDREMDKTKGELVRALRRRAAELDAQEDALLAARPLLTPRSGPAVRSVRQPNGRNAHQVAFFARHTFQFAAGSPRRPHTVLTTVKVA